MNAAAIRTLIAKGLSAEDIAEVAEALERKKDSTSAERQARYRAKRKEGKSRRNSNAVTPPIEEDHTPCGLSPNGENHTAPDRREPFPKPDFCDDDQVWSDFLANRKRKRLPNTATAHKGFLDDINRIADDEWPPGRLLKHAAAKGWGGIYDPRSTGTPNNDNRKSTGGSTRNAAQAALERLQFGG